MPNIVVNAELRAKLLAAEGVAVLRDEAGNVIGRFVPQSHDLAAAKYEADNVTDEELDRREREDRRFTAEQVRERLRGLRR
jgi:hypothetical protein